MCTHSIFFGLDRDYDPELLEDAFPFDGSAYSSFSVQRTAPYSLSNKQRLYTLTSHL
jgi:hypothetical protein